MGDLFYYVFNQFTSMELIDIIDIICVSILLYYVFLFIKERRAGKLAIGVVALLLGLFVANMLEMKALLFILENIVQVGILALIIIFQPELRSILEKMGGSSLKSLRLSEAKSEEKSESYIDDLCLAASDLSASKTGALIVLEQTTKLGDEIKTGVPLNADVSVPLIKNIFYNKAPLHDGAMIVRGNKIVACGCFLPLSQDEAIITELGTRHRASIGLSEISDAIIIVVSEETGLISVAHNGHLKRGFDKYSLKDYLIANLEYTQTPIQPLKKLTKKKK